VGRVESGHFIQEKKKGVRKFISKEGSEDNLGKRKGKGGY